MKELFFAFCELLIKLAWPLAGFLLIKMAIVLIGALFGLVVGWFIGDTILGIFAQIGISGFSMWQLGAFFGFVGSFFGSTLNVNDFRHFGNKSDINYNNINGRYSR